MLQFKHGVKDGDNFGSNPVRPISPKTVHQMQETKEQKNMPLTQKNNTAQRPKKSSYSADSCGDSSRRSSSSTLSPIIPGSELDAPFILNTYKALRFRMTDDPLETDNRTMFEAKKAFGLRDKYFRKLDEQRSNKLSLGSGGTRSRLWREQARWNYGNCGVKGRREVSKDGETRDKVFYCNHKNYCPRCSKRYSNGVARKARAIVEGILKSTKKSSLLTPTFTLPKEISEGIMDRAKGERKDILSDLHRGAAETLRTVFGQDLAENESLAVGTTVHTWKSSKPWKPHVHVHTMMPTVVLNKEDDEENGKDEGEQSILLDEDKDSQGELREEDLDKEYRGYLSEQTLERLKEVWAEVMRDRLAGYFPEFNWPNELDVHHGFVPDLRDDDDRKQEAKKTESKLKHKLRYSFRTHMEDLWKSVSRGELPEGRIPEFADINEKFRQSGERIRWYGYWSKGTRAENLKGYFGMRLVDDDDDDFDVDHVYSFSVLRRSGKYMWVNFKEDAGKEERLKRSEVKGEFAYSGGQLWECSKGGGDPPGEKGASEKG